MTAQASRIAAAAPRIAAAWRAAAPAAAAQHWRLLRGHFNSCRTKRQPKMPTATATAARPLCVVLSLCSAAMADQWAPHPSTPGAYVLVKDNSTAPAPWCYHSAKVCNAGSIPCHAPFDEATMTGGKDCCESGSPDETITELYGLDENGRGPETSSWWCEKNACWPTYFKEPEGSLWIHAILCFAGFGILIPLAGILEGGTGIMLDIGIVCGVIGFVFAFIYGDGHNCEPNPHNPCDGHMDCPHDYLGALAMVFWLGWRGYLFYSSRTMEEGEASLPEAIPQPLKIIMGIFCAVSSLLCLMGVTRGHPRGYTADYMYGIGTCTMLTPLALLSLVFIKSCRKEEKEEKDFDEGSD
eukprot:COSAG01_NODE_3250_length_6353_cov_445.752958_1_plen_354_part_00